jgi:hypothetical protein
MPVARRHSLYAININASLLGGITRQTIATGSEIKGEISSGQVYTRFLAMYAQKIAPGFTTRSVAAALTLCGAAGVDISTLSALCFYAYKHAASGARATGALHRSYAFGTGILFPTRLRCNFRGDATLDYSLITVSTGGNAPLVVTDTVTLPTGTISDEFFTLGPVKVANVTLSQVRSLEIDFGLSIEAIGADSDIWDTFCSIVTEQPQITLRGIDVQWLTEATGIPLAGKPAVHASTIIYLRKRVHGGTFVADATPEHVKFTADGMAYIDQAFDASGEAPAETSLVVPLRYDGTNAPITVNLASAIT